MAYGNDSGSMYDEEAAPSPADAEEQAPPEEKKDENTGTTALLPKTILAGKEFKPGEEIVLKIVKMYDDELEVEYSTGSSEEEEKSEGQSPVQPPSEDDTDDSMMM